jgi:hypothetical protein
MRYSIMLQLVGLITVVLVGTAAFFAWLQNRPIPDQVTGSEVTREALEDYDLQLSI